MILHFATSGGYISGMVDRQHLYRFSGIAVLVSAAAYILAVWAHATPGNDGFAALAREAGGASWLGPASYKPVEWLLLKLTRIPGVDPVLAWRLTGALQLGLLAALSDRLSRILFDEFPAAGLLAAFLVLVNPALLEICFQANSTMTASLGMLLLFERRIAGDETGTLAALALFSLSRIDALVSVPAAIVIWEGTRTIRLRRAAVWMAAVLVWVLLGWIVNGSPLGLISNMETYSRAAVTASMPLPGALIWLRGGILEMSSEGVILLAAAGFFLLASLEKDGISGCVRKFVLPAVHAGIILGLAVTGRPVFYRFLAPEIPVITVLSCGGLFWIASRLGQSSAARLGILLVMGAAGYLGYAGNLRALVALRETNLRHEAEARAALECLPRETAVLEHPLVVVPDPVHGAVAYGLRSASVDGVTYEREFVTRGRSPSPPVVWLRPKGETNIPVLMHGRSYKTVGCGAAGELFIFPFARRD